MNGGDQAMRSTGRARKRLGVAGRIAVTIGLAVVASAPVGRAQARSSPRGAPYDWSHRLLVASRFSPDLDKGISSDWRTFNKHVRIEQAIQARDAQAPLFDWWNVGRRYVRPQPPSRGGGAKLDWSLQTGGYGSVVGDPAKYSFDITAAHCSDVIYYSVNQPGSASAVNVIAITNPYATCPGNASGVTPTVKFGIQLPYGTATSVVPSLDGTILYVLESRPSVNGGVILHAINVNKITSNPGSYNFVTKVWSNAHVLATAPTGASSEQLFQLTFTGVTNNVSSPYLDYTGNQIFFGDASGKVHRVLNTQSAAASEDITKFPVACGSQQLQPPVFASSAVITNQVVVTSADGFVYRIDTNAPGAGKFTCIAAMQGGAGTSQGAAGGLAPPVVDVSNNQIIVATGNANGYGVQGVGTFGLNFAANSAFTSGAFLGWPDGMAPRAPSMDNAFWTTNSGNLYAPGTPSNGGDTYLIRIPYASGVAGTASGFAALHNNGTASSVQATSVTEFLTGSAVANPDFVFVGGGGGSYLFVNRISSNFGGSDGGAKAVDGFFAVPGGVSSGIVIDTNTAATTGTTATANIYFGTAGIASTVQSTIVQLAQQF
jgi:hypothetical protein